MLSARAGSPGETSQGSPKRVPPPVPQRRRATSSQSSSTAIFSKYRMNDIPRGTTYSMLMNSLLVDPYAEDSAPLRSQVQCGLIMTDSRIDDELSVATIEFTDTPKWLTALSRDPNGFPKKTKYGTLWNMTTVNTTAQDEDGQTEFIRAVIRGVDRVDLFYPEMLAEFEDVDVNIQDNMGRTALHWASERGLSDMVTLCLSVPDCNTGLRDKDGVTAFDLSGRAGNRAENIQTLFYTSIFDMEPRDPQSALLRALTITSEPQEDKPIFPGEAMFDPILDRNTALVAALIDRQVDLTARDGDGNTALHLAAGRGGNAEIVSKLLVAGADINAKGAGGATPLHQATYIAEQEVVQVLLHWNADITVRDTDGMTALQCAVQNRHREVENLLQRHQAPAPANDQGDRTAHQLATEIQSPKAMLVPSPEEVARMEEERRELFLRFKQLDDGQKKTALLQAAEVGDLGSLNLLLEMGIPVEIRNNAEMTPLALASQNGHNLVVKTLLAAGANIDASKSGKSPLMHASWNGQNEVVTTLLDAGANIEAGRIGETSLVGASSNGHNLVVKTLLTAGANIEAARMGKTALISASRNGQNEIVTTLLDAGANIEAGIWGETALVGASRNGHNLVVKTLLDAGANTEAGDMGETALGGASRRGQNEVVKMLLAAGANIEGDIGGEAALVRASRSGRNDVVKTLLAAGADVEASLGGKTALQLALEHEHSDVVDTLRTAGARSGAARTRYTSFLKLGIKLKPK